MISAQEERWRDGAAPLTGLRARSSPGQRVHDGFGTEQFLALGYTRGSARAVRSYAALRVSCGR